MTLANPPVQALKCNKHTDVVHEQHLNVCQARKHFQMYQICGRTRVMKKIVVACVSVCVCVCVLLGGLFVRCCDE